MRFTSIYYICIRDCLYAFFIDVFIHEYHIESMTGYVLSTLFLPVTHPLFITYYGSKDLSKTASYDITEKGQSFCWNQFDVEADLV